jgi:hypothetical protein
MTALRVILLTAAALGVAAPAQAQVYTQASLAPGQPYAIEVAPGTYMIQRPSSGRSYPYVGCGRDCAPASMPHAIEPRPAQLPAERPVRRARTHNDPALIEELRHRHTKKSDGKVINTVKIVREKPIVIERRRIVDDPPRVVERYRYEDGRPAKRADVHLDEPRVDEPRDHKKGAVRRVIHAEAEVTILGPDRMSIRLYRKQSGGGAQAQAD